MRSLRQRILIGSILWAVGLIVLSSAVFSVMIEHLRVPRRLLILHVHGTLQAPLIVALALLCLVAGALQVRRGLRRIDDLRSGLIVLREGRGRRLEAEYPSEVQPLVNDLNMLLENRDRAVQRAIAKAGDLAHGLKTPLAVLSKEAESMDAGGHSALAASMRQQVDRMRTQIDYHLAHARAAAAGVTPGTSASVRASVDGLVRAMQRIHVDRVIALTADCADVHEVRVQREDLDEMLGNLIDNACKWARTRVEIRSVGNDGHITIAVDDDGPGITEDLRAAVLQRGVRADEATPGSGLGLAIVRELAELYCGSIVLERSTLGGCRSVLRLPVSLAA
jgi:signal transduction histidine kinase